MRLAIIGQNIGYTKSPQIHDCIGKAVGQECSMQVCDLNEQELPKFFDKAQLFDAIFVTKPYKNLAKAFAKCSNCPTSCTNLITTHDMCAHNTDIFGFERGFDLHFSGKTCLILGNGGAAESVAYVAKKGGATVFVHGRNMQKVQQFAQTHSVQALCEDMQIQPHIVINATTNLRMAIPKICTDSLTHLCELSYLPSQFLQSFAHLQLSRQNGQNMLIWQAIKAWTIFAQLQLTQTQIDVIFDKVRACL